MAARTGAAERYGRGRYIKAGSGFVSTKEEFGMSYIDVAIPGLIGLITALWPQTMFWGSRAAPDPKKIRLIRIGGSVLLVVALCYLVMRLVDT